MRDKSLLFSDVARCQLFWNREETDRPLLSVWVGSYEIPNLYRNGITSLPEGRLSPSDIDLEMFRADYEKGPEDHMSVDVDVPWAALPLIVIPWVEAVAGCPVFHRGGNCRAEHWLETYTRIDEIQIRPQWLEQLREFIRWLVDVSKGRFPAALCLMRRPADFLAAVRGAERSIYDLIDHPEHVDRALRILTEVWIEVAHAQLELIPSFAGGYCFSLQNLWSPQPGGWF